MYHDVLDELNTTGMKLKKNFNSSLIKSISKSKKWNDFDLTNTKINRKLDFSSF